MRHANSLLRGSCAVLAAAALAACNEPVAPSLTAPITPAALFLLPQASRFHGFTELASSYACAVDGGDATNPFALPAGFSQAVFASEPLFPDVPDMNTVNETGANPNQFIYRTHETTLNGAVSVTNLETGETHILAQRADWERFDGIAWTPWGTILASEEVNPATLPDPDVPGSVGGFVYEINPATGAAVVRPAIGSRAHEGNRFDSHGALYGISETSPGYIYKFVPDVWGDLSNGQLYALKLLAPNADRTGEATWVPLDRQKVRLNSDPVATDSGATGYNRPEDLEYVAGTLYAAITGEDRVIGIDLGDAEADHAFVFDLVRAGMNVSSEFSFPDNLAFDKAGTLYIAEDPGGTFAGGKRAGDDIWTAELGGKRHALSASVKRFASLSDCTAEPTGIYFNLPGNVLFVNVQHRGGTGEDLAVRIRPPVK